MSRTYLNKILVSIMFFQVALRIRPLKNEEMARGYQSVATKVDSKVSPRLL